MKIFSTVREFYRIAGICPPLPQSERNSHFRFNWKYAIYFGFLMQLSTSAIVYFLFKAHSIVERADSFYGFSTGLSCAIITSISIRKISNIFKFIEDLEKFIGKSTLSFCFNFHRYCIKIWSNLFFFKFKIHHPGLSNPMSKTIYDKYNAKIERMSKLFYLVFVTLTTPGIVLPPLLITLVNYYVYGLGDESFYLPFREVYVWKWFCELKSFSLLFTSIWIFFFKVAIQLEDIVRILNRIAYTKYTNILCCISHCTYTLYIR